MLRLRIQWTQPSRSIKVATRRVTAGCGSDVPWASRKMTRRLPEGPWDPTKIPRIQILMSPDVFLVGANGDPSPQVETQIGQTPSVREVQLDEPHRSHNPKVGGSNPPPPPKRAQVSADPKGSAPLLPGSQPEDYPKVGCHSAA